MIAEVPLLDDRVAPMAVRAANLAARHLPLEHGKRALMAGQLHDPGGLVTDMVEIQDHRVGFPARDARVLAEEVK